MDPFTVIICKGLNNPSKKNAFIVALYFGAFQTFMPILGFYLGNILNKRIINFNPYLSTFLLISVGVLMIKNDDSSSFNNTINYKEMIILSIATSIDAFVIGISLSFLKNNIFLSSFIIGIITFSLCAIGFILGYKINKKIGNVSNFIAGLILIILGLKMLFENIFK